MRLAFVVLQVIVVREEVLTCQLLLLIVCARVSMERQPIKLQTAR